MTDLLRRLSRRAPRPAGEAQGFGFAELQGGGARVVIVPALGGKIAAMQLAGREWLWTNPSLHFREPVDGTSYVETADSGGFDECFPTVGPCTLPGAAGGWRGLELPDHGELWAQRPTIEIQTDAAGHAATCRWRGRRMPYEFTRTVRVTPAGEVVMHYTVVNQGDDRIPYLWSSHPLLPLNPETRIVVPDRTPMLVAAEHGIRLGGPGAEHRWPHVRLEKSIVDFSRPHSVGRRFACKLFLRLDEGLAAVEEAGARLEVRFDPARVPMLGLWINNRGWSGAKRVSPYTNLAFEPCSGAPDSLAEAIGTWNAARWLEPGEQSGWTLTWRGETLEMDEGGGSREPA